jgi:hypothetical protein
VVDASGSYLFTGLSNGSYLLSPSLAGWTFTPATLSVTVNGANMVGQNFAGTPVSVGVSVPGYVFAFPAQAILQVGGTYSVDVSAFNGDATPGMAPALRSSDAGVATVAGTVVTARGEGQAEILGGAPELVLSTVTVVAAANAPAPGLGLQLGGLRSALLLRVGALEQLLPRVFDAGGRQVQAPVTYLSSNPAAATVGSDGTVRAVAVGRTSIRVTLQADPGVTFDTQVVVVGTSTGPTPPDCSSDEVYALKGWQRVNLWAGGRGYDDRRPVFHSCSWTLETTNVGTWSSSNPAVASVDAWGHVTPHSCGETWIRFAPVPGYFIEDVPASTWVVVEPDWRGSWRCDEITTPAMFSKGEKAAATIVSLFGERPQFISGGGGYDAPMNFDPSRFGPYRSTQSEVSLDAACFHPWVPGVAQYLSCDANNLVYSDSPLDQVVLRKIQCVRQSYQPVCTANPPVVKDPCNVAGGWSYAVAEGTCTGLLTADTTYFGISQPAASGGGPILDPNTGEAIGTFDPATCNLSLGSLPSNACGGPYPLQATVRNGAGTSTAPDWLIDGTTCLCSATRGVALQRQCSTRGACLQLKVELGTQCGSGKSVSFSAKNTCEASVIGRVCLEQSDGTVKCGEKTYDPDQTVAGHFVCDGTGQYQLWATDPGDGSDCRGATKCTDRDPLARCKCSDRRSCLRMTKTIGVACGFDDSVCLDVENTCAYPVATRVCLDQLVGAPVCDFWFAEPGQAPVPLYVDHGTGTYRVWATDPLDAGSCRGY